MKTKLFLLCISTVFLFFSCQKEGLDLVETSQETLKLEQDVMLKELISEDIIIIDESAPFDVWPPFYPDTTITLNDCEQQQCFRVLPSLIGQMQRTANWSCKPINVSFCCCINGYERCFKLRIPPNIYCPNLKEELKLLPEKKVQFSNN